MWLSFFFPRKTHHNSILSRKMPKHRLTSAFHLFSCHKIRFLRNVLYFRRWTHKHEQSWFRSGWSLSDLNFSNPGQELPNKQTNREKTLKKKKKNHWNRRHRWAKSSVWDHTALELGLDFGFPDSWLSFHLSSACCIALWNG